MWQFIGIDDRYNQDMCAAGPGLFKLLDLVREYHDIGLGMCTTEEVRTFLR
jgi:hypothetical protein